MLAAAEQVALVERSAAEERKQWNAYKETAAGKFTSQATGARAREAELAEQLQVAQAKLAEAAVLNDELGQRERQGQALLQQLQARQAQAVSAAAAAGRAGGKGSATAALQALQQAQAQAETLQAELAHTKVALERERAAAGEAANTYNARLAEARAHARQQQMVVEGAAQAAQHELNVREAAAQEVRLQASLFQQRAQAKMAEERKMAEAREHALAQQKASVALQLRGERIALNDAKRAAAAAQANAAEHAAAARREAALKEAESRAAREARREKGEAGGARGGARAAGARPQGGGASAGGARAALAAAPARRLVARRRLRARGGAAVSAAHRPPRPRR